MGLSSAMITALTGMSGAETQISVVGNNLANSQTAGFKASDVTFANQFLSTLSQGSRPTDNNGGTNPKQIGMGSQVAAINPDFSQGTIEISSSETDLAIQGEGFFIVEGNQGQPLYTRNGMFDTNSDNELVSATGNRLLGYGVDEFYSLQENALQPLTIPLSANIAQATENVFLKGNLTPTGDVADTAEVIQSDVLTDSTFERPDASASALSTAMVPDVDAASTATAVVNPTGGNLTQGDYEYVFTFEDDLGNETLASSAISRTIDAVDDPADIQLNNLPTSTDFSTLNVYRREGGSGAYGLVDSTTPGGTFTDDQASTGAPLVDQTSLDGRYSYLVTFSGTGVPETAPSQLLGPRTVVNERFYLEDLPQPTDPAYDTINIYRNVASSSDDYYLVDEVAAGGADDYVDGHSDTEISDSSLPDYRELDMDGPKIDNATLLTDIHRRNELQYEQVFEEGELSYTGRKGDSVLTEKTLTVDGSTTVSDFLQFLEDASGVQVSASGSPNPIPDSENNISGENGTLSPGGVTTADGQLRMVSNNGVDNAVNIPASAFTMTRSDGTTFTPNLGFSSLQEGAGQSATADFVAYDSLGSSLDMRFTTVLESRDSQNTTYRWFAESGDNDPAGVDHEIAGGTGLIRFDGEGNMVEVTNDTVNIGRNDTPASNPLDFRLDFSQLSGFSDDASEIAVSRQDGSELTQLTNYSVGENGLITGIFDNGMSRTLGQVRLARFTNPDGLDQVGENMYNVAFNSTLPIEGNPGDQGLGSITAGAVELSNTDTGEDLIELLNASTQYRANSRVISTSQQLLDVLMNMRQ